VGSLHLPKEISLHEYRGVAHQLYLLGLDAIVITSAGAGFMQRMARQPICVLASSGTELTAACSKLAVVSALPSADSLNRSALALIHESEIPDVRYEVPRTPR
jgi:hypothetical protein